MTRALVAPFVIRTEKRTTTDAEGNSLFSPRTTMLVQVPFTVRHALQKVLYEEVSIYVLQSFSDR
jgi:hypothetical protein